MVLQKNRLVYVCLVCSIVGLALIYVAARSIRPSSTPISGITFDMVGRSVKTTGFISYKSNHQNGHIFLTITDGDGSSLQVPLFAGFVSSFEQHNKQRATADELRRGSLIEIEGLVGEYRGQLQVVPRKPDDLKILYD
jgi:DNA/RNA endonuclease YhcR with UshA esterase domain